MSEWSADVVKLGVGLVGTMAALVLGLLIASAKSSFDTQSAELTEMPSKVVMLDRILAHYGPETIEPSSTGRLPASRIAGNMRIGTHFTGNRVNQDLWLVRFARVGVLCEREVII